MSPVGGEHFDEIENLMQEVVVPEELATVLATDRTTGYIGIEPSGLLTTGQAFQIVRSVGALHRAGVHMTVLLADWHAYINDKLGGDMERIKACGRYLKEAFTVLGVDPTMTTYVFASDYVDDPNYWELVIRTLKASTLSRVRRALTIMGKKEDEAELDSSKVIYPAMQVSDIYYLDVDIALGGMDQRKAHMLCRDVAGKIGRPVKTPVALHFWLVPSLSGGDLQEDPTEAKMSKSRPETALFIHDTPEEIEGKLKAAFCPAGDLEGNPVTELARLIVMPTLGKLTVHRPEKWGGDIELPSWEALEEAFASEQLHPADLKAAVAEALAEIQRPVREHFERKPIHREFL